MPLYEYKCKKCGHHFEKIQLYSARMVKKCPECGGPVAQTITAPAVQFKGSGWYVTDYAKKSGSSASSDSGGKESKEGKESKKEEKSKPESSSTESSSKESSAKESSSKESSSKESSSRKSEKRK